MDKIIQLLVGPSALPDRVERAMAHPCYNHRTDFYKQVHHDINVGIQKIFDTKEDVYITTNSGTGVSEATIQNLFSPGDRVIVPDNGAYATQYADIAEAYGLEVERVRYPLGKGVDIDDFLGHIKPDTKAVLMVHNESSTGVVNDIEKMGLALKKDYPDVLFLVDTVSAAGGIELHMDDWNIDALFTASQKCLMSPPGLGFVAISEKAREAYKTAKCPRWYNDFKHIDDYSKRDLTFYTPATHTMLAVQEALKMMDEEGLENIYKRHKENRDLIRNGLREIGIGLFVEDDADASATLTCVSVPGQAHFYENELLKRGIQVGTGKSDLGADTFRVGTMGYVSHNDCIAFLEAMKEIKASL